MDDNQKWTIKRANQSTKQPATKSFSCLWIQPSRVRYGFEAETSPTCSVPRWIKKSRPEYWLVSTVCNCSKMAWRSLIWYFIEIINYSFQKFLVISMMEFSVSITFLKTGFSSCLIFLSSPVGCSLSISMLISPGSLLSANSSCEEVSGSFLWLKVILVHWHFFLEFLELLEFLRELLELDVEPLSWLSFRPWLILFEVNNLFVE